MKLEDIINLIPTAEPKKEATTKRKIKQNNKTRAAIAAFLLLLILNMLLLMKNKWYNNIFYVPNLKGKWYRHLNILAAIFVFIGGVGLNTYHTLPKAFYIVTLAIGAVIFAIFLVMIQRGQQEDNTN